MVISSDVISVCSLIVSCGTLFYAIMSHISQSKFMRAELELVNIQIDETLAKRKLELKAHVTARIYNQSRGMYKIRVVNTGPAEAHNVNILIDDQNEMIQESFVRDYFPMVKMDAGQSIDFPVAYSLGTKQKERLTIEWDDEIERGRRNIIDITM